MLKRRTKGMLALLLAGVLVCSATGGTAYASAVDDGALEGTIVEDTAADTQKDDAKQQVSAGITQDTDAKVNAEITQDTDAKVNAEITQDTASDDVVIASDDKPYLALGANLTDEQKQTVLALLGVDAAKLADYHVVDVTNEEEHQYLDAYLDAATIGTRALSSVVIVKREKGNGIHISTKNISYCTVGMYKNALATAGLADADVVVAGPFPISGTAALIGAMKAYADMEGEPVDTESLDAAMNELVVTGTLGDKLDDAGQSEEFIAYVKQKVLEGGLDSTDDIRAAIADACEKFNVKLSDDEKEQITSLMKKIGALDIDVDSLMEQAGAIYDSLAELDGGSGILAGIAAFFKSILEALSGFFAGLF